MPLHALALAVVGATSGGAPSRGPRPNVVLIRTDDQEQGSLSARLPDGRLVMHNVHRLLVEEGEAFRTHFVSTPLCSPSRATLLTGQYAHNHHVYTNSPPYGGYPALDASETLPVWLRRAGYRTIYAGGKYMNAYDGSAPPGWDQWFIATPGYYDYTINENGVRVSYGYGPSDYATDVTTRIAVRCIRASKAAGVPFFLLVDYFAPHRNPPYQGDPDGRNPNPIPAPRHRGTLAGSTPVLPPSFNEADVSDKPQYVRTLHALGPTEIRDVVDHRRDTLEALRAVDDGVGAILEALGSTGLLDATYVLYTSDNGYQFGEHRLFKGKDVPYRESVNVPLLVRGPGVPRNLVREDVVGNVDLAPTIAELAGATPTRVQDGISLVPLLSDPAALLDRDLLIEIFEANSPGVAFATGLYGRTSRYAEYDYDGDGTADDVEVYRTSEDGCSGPDEYELQNLIRDPCEMPFVRWLHERAQALRLCSGAGCR